MKKRMILKVLMALCVLPISALFLPSVAEVLAKSQLPSDAYWRAPKGAILAKNGQMTKAELAVLKTFNCSANIDKEGGVHRLPTEIYRIVGKKLVLQKARKGVVKLEPKATYLVWVDTRQLLEFPGTSTITGEIGVTRYLGEGGFCQAEFMVDNLCYFGHLNFNAVDTTVAISDRAVPLLGETGKTLDENGYTFTIETGVWEGDQQKQFAKGKDPANLLSWTTAVKYLVKEPPAD